MEVVDVDDVGAHVAQRALALLAHECRIVITAARTFHVAKFCREKNFRTRDAIPHLSDQLFSVSVAVRVGGVPMRDAVAIRGDERVFRGIVVRAAPSYGRSLAHVRASVAPGAEGGRRELEIRSAEANRAHGARFYKSSMRIAAPRQSFANCDVCVAASFLCPFSARDNPYSDRGLFLLRSRSSRNTFSASAYCLSRSSAAPSDSRVG